MASERGQADRPGGGLYGVLIVLATRVLEPPAHRRDAVAQWVRLTSDDDAEGLSVYWGLVTTAAWLGYGLTFFPPLGFLAMSELAADSLVVKVAFLPSAIFAGHGVVGMIQIGRARLPFWRSHRLGRGASRWAVVVGAALWVAGVWL